MTELITDSISALAPYAPVWGLLIVFLLMTMENSLVPLPGEAIMIPAGFMAFRGEMLTGNCWADALLVVLSGTAGSLAGAYINYFLALFLGRGLLYKYGRYFFLKQETLQRAEEMFRQYGAVTTFVCRLLPMIRQFISIPAGLSKMRLDQFTLYTGLGAGIWMAVLTGIGAWLGRMSGSMSYAELVSRGERLLIDNYIWIFLALAVFVAGYIAVHRLAAGIGRSPRCAEAVRPEK